MYGVILVSGMIIVTGDKSDASWDVFLRVLGTVLVFWAAHVYAGTVAELGAGVGEHRHGFAAALTTALRDSLGLLLAACLPLIVLLFGAAGVIADDQAVWGALWVDVVVLAILGYLGVARWSATLWVRLIGAAITAALGAVVVVLKTLIH